MKNAQRLTALIALTLIALAANTATATEGVSPGALDRLAVVETRCPTFSWGAEYGAQAYEIVGYSLSEESDREVELSSENEVLYTRVTGSAAAWTPSADQCFAPGGRYVWFVRAVTELIDDQVIEAGEWSTGRYFQVPAGPSAEDVARAVEVLKQWEAANGSGSLPLFADAGSAPVPASAAASGTGTGSGSGSNHLKSVPTAAAAIRGEHPDTSGEKYGVVGTSASTDGAGVAAANLDGGPDLVLDGSADGGVDTVIHESVLKRSSPDDEIFLFHNGGGGALDLHVHGTLNGDGLNVQYGPVIDDDGNWLGVGDTVPCTSCVTSSDIADGSIIDNDLAVDAVTEEKIEHGAVGTTKLQNNSVTSAKIADGTIASDDLAVGSVGSSAIIDSSIRAADLGANAVTSEKIADFTITSPDLAVESVASVAIIDGTIRTVDLGVDAVTTGKIDDGTITGADIDPTSWVYVSKNQLYERIATVDVVPAGGQSITAYCDDADDLPIGASCSTESSALWLVGDDAIDWTSGANSAGFECRFLNEFSVALTGTAKILCITVP